MKNPVYENSFTVDEKSEDYLRHVNNLRYLEWFIDSAVAHADILEWGANSVKEIGLAWVAKSHEIEYLLPAYQNDALLIRTWIEKVTPTRITRCYECKRGDQLIAQGRTVWVIVDYESGKARALPKTVQETFMEVVR